jgi:hypothetical protein
MVNNQLGNGKKFGEGVVQEIIDNYLDVLTTLLAQGKLIKMLRWGYMSLEVIPRGEKSPYELKVHVRMGRTGANRLRQKFPQYFKVKEDTGEITALDGMKGFLEEPPREGNENYIPPKWFRQKHNPNKPKDEDEERFKAAAEPKPKIYDKWETVEVSDGEVINEDGDGD